MKRATTIEGTRVPGRRRTRDAGLQLAVQDWRIDFLVAGQTARVLGLRSGYRASQLARTATGNTDPLQLHRDFIACFD